jgi:hypothetical protein
MDEQFEVLLERDVSIRWVRPGWVTNGYFAGGVQLPPRTRYIVVYTAQAHHDMGQTISTFDAGFTYSTGKSVVFVPGTGAGTASVPCAPTGELTLSAVR